jgi:hypothetical protein
MAITGISTNPGDSFPYRTYPYPTYTPTPLQTYNICPSCQVTGLKDASIKLALIALMDAVLNESQMIIVLDSKTHLAYKAALEALK